MLYLSEDYLITSAAVPFLEHMPSALSCFGQRTSNHNIVASTDSTIQTLRSVPSQSLTVQVTEVQCNYESLEEVQPQSWLLTSLDAHCCDKFSQLALLKER